MPGLKIVEKSFSNIEIAIHTMDSYREKMKRYKILFFHEKDYVNEKKKTEINKKKLFSTKQVFHGKVNSSIKPRMSKNKVK